MHLFFVTFYFFDFITLKNSISDNGYWIPLSIFL